MGHDYVLIKTMLCHMVELTVCAGGARALRRLAQDNAHVRFR